MDPLLANRLRQSWPVFAAFALLVGFLLVDSLVFHPLASRFHTGLRNAGALGAAFAPDQTVPPLPPRVFALLAENSMPAAQAEAQGQNGQLAAHLMQDLSQVAGRHDLELVVTEPGVLTSQSGSLQVRAHLRLRGRYPSIVAFMDDLSRSGRLYRIERMSIVPGDNGRHDMELHVERLVLKRAKGKP